MDEHDQAVPAGWHPDPQIPGQERLWDGAKWLNLTRPHDPGRVEPNPAGWRVDPQNLMYERLWGGEEWTDQRRDNAELGDPDRPKGKEKTYPDSKPPRALASLSAAAIVFLALTICANIAVILTSRQYIGYESELLDGANPGFTRINHASEAIEAATAAYLIAALLAAAFFIAWFYRAYRNLPRRGMSDLRFAPGWAIGGWFVPILALVRPKQIANDIWRGSAAYPAATPSWRNGDPGPLLNWWWGVWVAGGVLSAIGGHVASNATRESSGVVVRSALESERTGLYVDQAASLLLIAAAVLAIVVIRKVSAMQDDGRASADRRQLVTAPPPPLP